MALVEFPSDFWIQIFKINQGKQPNNSFGVGVNTVKSKGKISPNFVAFSECMNVTEKSRNRLICVMMTGKDWKVRVANRNALSLH